MPRYPIGPAVLELAQGDIVTQDTDAIVNAANEGLAQGGGVCGAIFAVVSLSQIHNQQTLTSEATRSRLHRPARHPTDPQPTGAHIGSYM